MAWPSEFSVAFCGVAPGTTNRTIVTTMTVFVCFGAAAITSGPRQEDDTVCILCSARSWQGQSRSGRPGLVGCERPGLPFFSRATRPALTSPMSRASTAGTEYAIVCFAIALTTRGKKPLERSQHLITRLVRETEMGESFRDFDGRVSAVTPG
jgi:hypothetical protein